MLVLGRKQLQALVIDSRIRVTILRIDRNQVKIGVEAPEDLTILRGELFDAGCGEWETDPADLPAPSKKNEGREAGR